MARRALISLVVFALTLVGVPAGPAVALAADGGSGSVALNTMGVPASQNFDTLSNASSGSNLLPAGWFLSESGASSRNDGKYWGGTGSDNAGDTYSFGASGSGERAFGTLLSGTLTPIIGASFTNNTAFTITQLTVSYTGEQWRLGAIGRGADRLDFQYSLSATSLSTGIWTDVNALDFSSPFTSTAGALNGNAAANRTSLGATFALTVPSGSSFWIRWTDFNVTNSDDGLAVDDFSITPSGDDVAPAVKATSPLAGASNVARTANVSVTFSEPVTVTDPWYTLSCATSGTHTAATSGGPATFALDPDTDFAWDELCTVTVLAAGVSDQDANDPPDHMAADYVFSFQTEELFQCGDPAVRVHDIQGGGASTPIPGTTVRVEGVVVGDYQSTTSAFGGFFVEDRSSDWDGDAATSEGVFVFDNGYGVDVHLGDVVRVRGKAGEFAGETEISSVNAVLVCSTGASVPAASVSLPVAGANELERFEGMLVRFDQTLTATEVYSLGRYGEVSLSGAGRLYTPTAVTAPGASAAAWEEANNRSRIVLDDGNDQQNIDPTRYPQGGLSATNTLRVGDTLGGLTGVMDYRHGGYRIQPVGPIAFDHTNPRTAAPEPLAGNLKVASFNVLNFFNGDGHGGGFPTTRGATTYFEFQRQLAKEVSALAAMNADIVGLMELENDAPPYSAIEDLVAGVNAALGANTYSFIDTGIIGTDQIKVGIIYKTATVTPVGAFKLMTSSVDPRFIDTLNRPSLAQTFEHVLTGERLTVVVNHLKSKGSGCESVGDPDTGDGQGACNLTRTAAAQALTDWIAADPTGSGDPDYLLIGDMNSYTFEDPITAFTTAGLENLVRTYGGVSAYSYVFNGESGYLDHALATPPLGAQVTGVGHWHINPDEPTVLDYNTEFKTAGQITSFYDAGPYRASDHDPVVVGLRLAVVAGTGGKLEGTPGWIRNIKTKLNVDAKDGGITGRITFEGDGRAYDSTGIDAIVVHGADATVFGSFGAVAFRIDVHDGGRDREDTLRLRTSDGYDSGVLGELRGNLTVWP